MGQIRADLAGNTASCCSCDAPPRSMAIATTPSGRSPSPRRPQARPRPPPSHPDGSSDPPEKSRRPPHHLHRSNARRARRPPRRPVALHAASASLPSRRRGCRRRAAVPCPTPRHRTRGPPRDDPASQERRPGPRRFARRRAVAAAEVALCGHATLATAHFLFTAILGEHHGVVEFATKSGILTAKKVPAPETEEQGKLFIELDFPMSDYAGCDPADELPSIPETLNGASVVSVHKSLTTTDFIVELSSGKEVADLLPNIEEIRKCAGRGVIVTGPAPPGSGYDFFSRFFCPKFGIDEDPVCGSAHCVLAPYWGEKLGKQKMIAFQASPRSGKLYLELDVANKRVLIQGEAVTIMSGTLFA